MEERLDAGKKADEEVKAVKSYVEKLEQRLKELTEENNKTIDQSNDMRGKMAELQKELDESRAEKQRMVFAQQDGQTKAADQLSGELKKKDEIIINYEKKFEEMEEAEQNALMKTKQAEDKIAKVEGMMERVKREMEEVRKENERLALERASEANTFMQERIEFKKAISVSEKTIMHLMKEKMAFEGRFTQEKERNERYSKKMMNKEVQTETEESPKKSLSTEEDPVERLKAKLLQKEEELHTANNYSGSLLQEFKKMQERLTQSLQRCSDLEKAVDDKAKAVQHAERENVKLNEMVADLKKRRESAASEITKLTQQMARRTSKPPREAGRHMSEAVIGTQAANKGLTMEQELILSTRKELDLLYKELIRSIFTDSKPTAGVGRGICFCSKPDIGAADNLKAGGAIELKLTTIMEKLADYCDDQLAPTKSYFLVAKMRGQEGKEEKKGNHFGQPPAAVAKRSPAAQMQYVQKLGPFYAPEPGVRSPARKFTINGPVKVLRDPQSSTMKDK
ncbi:MAG: hypothetical protein P4L67_04250 [Candidatus Pacebacteria bacterium]|nr:hypothetical protein [Candidatus Paceibacterota bacterium]